MTPPQKEMKIEVQEGRGDPETPPSFTIERPVPENHFVLEVIQSTSFKQSNAAREITYRARLKNPTDDVPLSDLSTHIQALFESILDEARRDYGEEGVMRIFIRHPRLERPIIVPPTYLGLLNSQMIMDQIDRILYSAGEIPAGDSIEINAVVELLKGQGRRPLINLDRNIKGKRSFVRIVNNDSSCLARAIIVGFRRCLALEHKENREIVSHYNRVRDSRNKLQGIEAQNLMRSVDLPLDKPGLVQDIPKYERFLETSIVVISARIGNKKVYNGSPQYDKNIFLYHTEEDGKGHFDLITKVNGMMCKQYYCTECDKAFKTCNQHKCKKWCNVCGRSNCEITKEITCVNCNKKCRSQECLKKHKEEITTGRGKSKNKKLPSMCKQFWQCSDCHLTLKRDQRDPSLHECGEILCKVCDQFHNEEEDYHKCYMRAFSSDLKPDKFIFYDFECTQENGKHTPNFVVAQSICTHCESKPITSEATCNNCGSRCQLCDKFDKKEKEWERNPCPGCGKRQMIFKGPQTQLEFCKWLISEQHRYVTAIAHNARAYDAYFLYEYLMKNSIIPKPTIFNGSKIMYMKVGRGLNIRIIIPSIFYQCPWQIYQKPLA